MDRDHRRAAREQGVSPQAKLALPLPRQALWRPNATALVLPGRSLSYAQLEQAVDGLSGQLESAGLRPGQRLALLLPDGLRFVAAVHAAAQLGAVVVPLNRRLKEAELAWQLRDSEPSLVLVECSWEPRIAAAAPELRRLRLPAADLEGASLGKPLAAQHEDPVATAVETQRVSLDAAQAILYTSGTTGRPKGVVLSFGNQLFSAMGSAIRLGGLGPGDRWLAPLPLFHIGGLATVWRCALYGAALRLPSSFDAAHLARIIEEEPVSHVSLVPTLLGRILDRWEADRVPWRLRYVLLGGGPIPPSLLAQAAEAGFPVAPTYGLTEACSQVATAAAGDHSERSASEETSPLAVPPMPFTRLAIQGVGEDEAEPGQVGEILVSGPTVMAGYWRREQETELSLKDGWLHTGDHGSLDADGRLSLSGRRTDLIVSGGENVYPAEVEAALMALPEVVDCAVIGLDDADWGQRVAAAIVLAADLDRDLGLSKIEAQLRSRIAGFKRPRRWRVLGALPRTASGKVDRTALREGFRD